MRHAGEGLELRALGRTGRHEVPLAAAALQFSLREPRIVSTIAGASRPERIDRMLELARWPIPPELWDELHRSETGGTVE